MRVSEEQRRSDVHEHRSGDGGDVDFTTDV